MRAPAPDLLAAIVAATRTRVRAAQDAESLDALLERSSARAPRGRDFAAALARPQRLNIIAECKRRSPSRGVLRAAYDPEAIATAYSAAGAAAISVLTEPGFFDGSLSHLAAIRQVVDTPLLRKDFIVDEYQIAEAVAAGADAILLIVSALDDATLIHLHGAAKQRGLAVLVEAHSEDEVSRALDAGATIVGINNRNLRTLGVDVDLSERIAARLPRHVTAVCESGLRTHADLRRFAALGYRAFLIGERCMTAPDPGAALRELLAEPAA
ncbi:MAG: indole-3-glycerol phosphate synthase TrpC [Acidobacteria bacterium]|nr:indole-3-glycerol phosphate synthase TrpC [Acidobacteriota bacterium]